MEYFSRLKTFWFPSTTALVWLLFSLPALYFFQTVIHEGAHAVSALMVSGHFPKLAPFPHLTSSGNFLNGVTIGSEETRVTISRSTSCDNPTTIRFTRLAGHPSVPQFVSLAISIILAIIFIFTSAPSVQVRLGLKLWYLGACVDFMYSTARGLIGGCNESADWSKFMLESGMATPWFAVLTWIFWLLILSHFIWVFWAQWERRVDVNFWNFRWFSFLLGTLSLLAVLLSIFVNDANIDKGSAAFIVPLIVQLLFLCWYWIYFGLTYKYGSS